MISAAFTCTGPYAILIMLGIKRVENRNVLPTPSKGRCAISCSKSFTKEEYGEFVRWAALNLRPDEFETIPAWNEVKDWLGRIVGTCDYAARRKDDLVLTNEVRTRGVSPEPKASREAMLWQGCASLPWDEGYEYWWDLSDGARERGLFRIAAR